MRSVWRLEEKDEVSFIRCEALLEIEGVAHAFSTRRAGGRDDFDLGGPGKGSRDLEARRERFLEAAGFAGRTPRMVRQVHGARVVCAADSGRVEEADALIWLRDAPLLAIPSVRTADCVPILLVDLAGRAAAAVHAGWRGTAAAIAIRAVEALAGHGVRPEKLVVALGPAILSCCYEVEPRVAEAVAASSGGGAVARDADRLERKLLDLHDANRRQLLLAGVVPEAIHAAPWCTRCRGDLFFSHRREGAAAGRMMASVGRARGAEP